MSSFGEQNLGLEFFGGEALASTDLDQLLVLACEHVTKGLDVSHAKVLEYLPDERQLLIRAGVGWEDNVVGVARLGADLDSPAGYALQTGQPTIANDLPTEQRFRVPEVLAHHGVRSAVNVIIKHGDSVFGVLEADSSEPRAFDERDVHFLQGYANILAMSVSHSIIARDNEQLSTRLEIMQNELRHRTKNNNQMLISMINLEKQHQKMLAVRQVLDDVGGRINILNAIDDLIIASDEGGKIDLGRYVLSIVNNIFALDAERAQKIRLDADTSTITVDTRRAQAVAIIVNEFLTNSFKYAFQEDKGEIAVKLEQLEHNARLTLSDDGPGISENSEKGVGLRLIDAMADVLDGNSRWDSNHGTKFELEFPIDTE